MKDPVERLDALDAITAFRRGIFHEKNLTADNARDWDAAYCMQELYDAVYKLPAAMPREGRQEVKQVPWSGEMHTCSECGKIVPFIDWCQPYCSGCGVRFTNYQEWCAKERAEDDADREEE